MSSSVTHATIATWLTLTASPPNLAFSLPVALALAVGLLWLTARAQQGRRTRRNIASLSIDGVPLDSLALSEMRKLSNADLEVQEVEHRALIQGHDLRLAMRIRARCVNRAGTDGVDFSLHGDAQGASGPVECYGIDHQNDPTHALRISPRAKPPGEGLTRQVVIPLLTRASSGDPVDVELFVFWPGCMRWGKDYFSSAVRFLHQQLIAYEVELAFLDSLPTTVWAYRLHPDGQVTRDGAVPLFSAGEHRAVFRDFIDPKVVDQPSTRVYIFDRPESLLPSERAKPMRRSARDGGGSGGGGSTY